MSELQYYLILEGPWKQTYNVIFEKIGGYMIKDFTDKMKEALVNQDCTLNSGETYFLKKIWTHCEIVTKY